MKWVIVVLGFMLFAGWSAHADISNPENCEYATQDNHTVSNSSYQRLLASLTKQTDGQKRRKRRQRQQTGQRGQR